MDIKRILLGIIVILIIYAIYSYFFSDHTNVNLVGLHNAKKQLRFEGTSLPGNPGTVDYTFSIWLYINSFNYRHGEEKIILYRGADKKNNASAEQSPLLTLGGSTNTLTLKTLLFGDSRNAPGKESSPCTIENIPLQKWVHVLFTTNSRSMDMYLDGKLVKTCMLGGVPKMNKSSPLLLTPDGGFSGYTSKLRFLARSVDPREVYAIYKEGYSDSLLGGILSKYKLKLSFLSGSEEINSISI
jgi:hypothetical protein